MNNLTAVVTISIIVAIVLICVMVPGAIWMIGADPKNAILLIAVSNFYVAAMGVLGSILAYIFGKNSNGKDED